MDYHEKLNDQVLIGIKYLQHNLDTLPKEKFLQDQKLFTTRYLAQLMYDQDISPIKYTSKEVAGSMRKLGFKAYVMKNNLGYYLIPDMRTNILKEKVELDLSKSLIEINERNTMRRHLLSYMRTDSIILGYMGKYNKSIAEVLLLVATELQKRSK